MIGESVQATFLGKLNRQEDLPLTGNHVGDAYFVGAQTFVWVAPNGESGMWIDPQ